MSHPRGQGPEFRDRIRPSPARWTGSILLACLTAAHSVQADPSDICLAAADDAAADSGVPLSVLLAITQTETGRGQGGETRPWPWTVNMEGEGHWFDSREAALDFVLENYNRGARSFDIGCFQINFRWHGENFASIEQMFDPAANAGYAARFLTDLHQETGDWSAAAGAFHSRTEVHATRYRTTFDRFRALAIAGGADGPDHGGGADVLLAAAGPDALPRTNSFQLLQTGSGTRTLGSLVPLSP